MFPKLLTILKIMSLWQGWYLAGVHWLGLPGFNAHPILSLVSVAAVTTGTVAPHKAMAAVVAESSKQVACVCSCYVHWDSVHVYKWKCLCVSFLLLQ